MTVINTAARPADIAYEPLRPLPSEEDPPVQDVNYSSLINWNVSSDNFMNIQFNPDSTGEYGAAVTSHIEVTLSESLRDYTGAYVELQVNVGLGWGPKVSKPDLPGTVSVTLDVAQVLTDSLLLTSSSNRDSIYYQAVLRVVGVLTGYRKVKIAIGWHAEWVHGESQDLYGYINVFTTLTAVKAYVKQNVLPLEPSAARDQSEDPDWETL